MKKVFKIEITEGEKGEKAVNRSRDNMSAFELLGLLEWVKAELLKEVNTKPNK